MDIIKQLELHSTMKAYIIYIIIGISLLSLIKGTFKIERSERNQRLYNELCQIDKDYCVEE